MRSHCTFATGAARVCPAPGSRNTLGRMKTMFWLWMGMAVVGLAAMLTLVAMGR